MTGLSEDWFRANSARVIDLGEARKKRKKSQREQEEDEQRRTRYAVIERAGAIFGDEMAAYSAAYVGVKERLLDLGFSVAYADKAAKLLATDYEADAKEPSFW
jgi:nucleosome binding factor SPN SPT16 subunit